MTWAVRTFSATCLWVKAGAAFMTVCMDFHLVGNGAEGFVHLARMDFLHTLPNVTCGLALHAKPGDCLTARFACCCAHMRARLSSRVT